MSTFTIRSVIPASADDLYAWHARPAAFLRLNPPWEKVEITGQEGSFGVAPYRVTLRTSIFGPIKGKLVSEAYDFRPGEGFQDRLIEGPFKSWNHRHTMAPEGPETSYLEDHIDFNVPLGAIGRLLGKGVVRNRLRAMFAYRHSLTASDLRRHALYKQRPRLKIIITGSRGLIGSNLSLFLATGGHSVTRLVSGPPPVKPPAFDDGTRTISWDPQAPVDPAILEGSDAVIHLAADGIADSRWTNAKRKKIIESRRVPTRNLAEAIAALPPDRRPKTFLSASGIGIYGERGDDVLTEASIPGTGFLADVCKVWEAAAAPASTAGVRAIQLRIGVVLTPKGGALGKQLLAFRAGLGATLGTGKQWVPWISIQDVVGAIHHCLMCDTLDGPVNLVTPNPVSNREFSKSLGRVLHRPAWMWLPRIALKTMFGEIADAALLSSMRASPQKLLESGFAFDYPTLDPALRFLLGKD